MYIIERKTLMMTLKEFRVWELPNDSVIENIEGKEEGGFLGGIPNDREDRVSVFVTVKKV